MTNSQIQPLLLGQHRSSEDQLIAGFQHHDSSRRDKTDEHSLKQNIHAQNDEHIVTIAPTGAGKGVGSIIPNLLRNTGPAVVIDPKGENYLVTARARKAMGHRVVLLDPFAVIARFDPASKSDCFNPFDILDKRDDRREEDAILLANMLVTGRSQTDPFWDKAACELISGMIVYLLENVPWILQTLNELHYRLGDGPDGFMQTLTPGELARQNSFVQTTVGMALGSTCRTRTSIRTVALSHCAPFASKMVSVATSATTFSLEDFIEGRPMTIYIVLPPEKLYSHAALLRIWLASLVQLVTRRTRIPEQPTTLYVDEAAQLGTLDELRMAASLLRGYGLRLWTFWQDLSQLKNLYPDDWQTILNNTGTIQIFGRNHGLALRELALICNPIEEGLLFSIGPGEQLLLRRGGKSVTARQVDYRTEKCFEEMFDQNAFYNSARQGMEGRRITPETAPSSAYGQGRQQTDEAGCDIGLV